MCKHSYVLGSANNGCCAYQASDFGGNKRKICQNIFWSLDWHSKSKAGQGELD